MAYTVKLVGVALLLIGYRRGCCYEMWGNAGGQQTDLFDEEDRTEAQELILERILTITNWNIPPIIPPLDYP
jgi:hypothetical protein